MDRTTASYYRSFLFNDAESQEPIPASLVQMHRFAHRRYQALGKRVEKTEAMQTCYFWMCMTGEGRKFAQRHPDLQGLFSATLADPDDEDEDSDGDAAPSGGFQRDEAVLVTNNGVETEGRFVFVSKTGLARVVVDGVQKRIPIADVRRCVPVSG